MSESTSVALPGARAAGERLTPLLETSGAVRHGHFLLSSGLHSPVYVQCALLLELPSRARQVGAWLADLLAAFEPQSVLSPALGGVVIGHEVAAALGVPFRFVERDPAGGMALRRGFQLAHGERVVIVEDVVTTGRSTVEAADVARRLGAVVVGAGAILDRSGGVADLGVPFHALGRLDLPTWTPDACPLCAAGGRAEKPGSRPSGTTG